MYSAANHLLMMQDARRMDAYARAIRAAVRAGDTILDLGCGAGVMTFLALEAGAAHVFAVEPSESIELARKVAAANGISNITFFKADIRKVELPRRVDVLIADLRGALPVFGDSLQVIDTARETALRTGGKIIPQRDRIFVAPIESEVAYRSVSSWRGTWGGVDFSCLADVAANQMRRIECSRSALLAEPTDMTPVLDYMKPAAQELSLSARFEIRRGGTCHGLVAWFESDLGSDITLSASPLEPPAIYGQAYFPIKIPIALSAGEFLEADLRIKLVGPNAVWTWSVASESAPRPRERYSSLRGALISPVDLAARAEDHIPKIDIEGQIDRAILNLATGQATNRSIADRIMAEFPEQLRTAQDALSRVGQLTSRYGRGP